jgi:hypothetical protein
MVSHRHTHTLSLSLSLSLFFLAFNSSKQERERGRSVEYLIRLITKAIQTGIIKYSIKNCFPSTYHPVGAGWMVGGWETVFN